VSWEEAAAPDPASLTRWTESRPGTVTPARIRAVASPSAKSPYYNGAVVKHAKFGIGTVQRSEGSGDDLKISVSFPGHGVKTLAVKYANLEVI
jgi:DNA helicase-2/ATP-dependent DNA helicase PcrA